MLNSTREAHAARQRELYQGVWAQDSSYGTRDADVKDTVEHRIFPHMRRLFRDWRSLIVVDFGAGDGRFLREMIDNWNGGNGTLWGSAVDVYMPPGEHLHIYWHQQPMWDLLQQTFDYAISTDSLEHIPTDMVRLTLLNIKLHAPHGFLRISTKQDIYGTERGLHLHETVQPPEWWLDQLRQAGIEPSSWRIYPGHAVEVWF